MMTRKFTALFLFVAFAFACDKRGRPTARGTAKSKRANKTDSEKKSTDKPAEKTPEKTEPAKDKDAKDTKGKDAEPTDPMSSGTFGALKFRSVGPAVISGRVASLAVNPHNKSQYFVGVASGGVWRTDNDGTTWVPVFDREGSYSIGTVVIDPKRPNVVWVGTGENNSQRSVSYGDGVYRSEDAGKTWKNI